MNEFDTYDLHKPEKMVWQEKVGGWVSETTKGTFLILKSKFIVYHGHVRLGKSKNLEAAKKLARKKFNEA